MPCVGPHHADVERRLDGGEGVGADHQHGAADLGGEQRLEQRRKDIIAAYERIVEGKPDLAKELTAGFEITDKQIESKGPVFVSNIDFDRLINDLDRTQKLWDEYLEMEDEDLMVLL